MNRGIFWIVKLFVRVLFMASALVAHEAFLEEVMEMPRRRAHRL